MFILSPEKSKFYKVKRGQTKNEVALFLSRPVQGECYAGRIIPAAENFFVYAAEAGETFQSLSKKFSVPESELEKSNGGIIYPGRKLLVPKSD